MSIAEAYEHGEKKSQKGHFRNLVMIARADGEVSATEQELMSKAGRSLGLTDEQIKEIKDHPEKYPMMPPVSLEDRTERLIALVEMVNIDGVIDALELDVLYRYSAGLGFPDSKTAELVNKVINGLQKGQSKSELSEELIG